MADFDDWYEEQYRRVLAACVVVSRDLDLARDATDEAFARAYQHWSRVSAMSAPGGWVQTVAFNHLRRASRRRRIEQLLLRREPQERPVDVVDAEVWDAVRRLPSRQQTAVALRYLHDLTEPQVAEVMGVSRGAVSASLSAARKHLRARLDNPDESRTSDGETNQEESLHG